MIGQVIKQRHIKLGYLVLLPAGLWLVVFLVLPVAILLVFSLGSRNDLGQVIFSLNFDNYVRFFSGPYLKALWRSVGIALMTTVVCLVLGFLCAMWLAFLVEKRKRQTFMMLVVAPLWTSFLLRMYAWITILRPEGILNNLLAAVGIINCPSILYSPYAVLLGMVYNYLPFMILPLFASLEKLDLRLLEAASDLGATPFHAFLRITLPLSFGGIVAGVTMVFVPCLGDYVTPDLLGGAKSMFVGNLIQNQFLTVRDWTFGSAVSTILIVIVAVFVWVYVKWGQK